MTNPDILSQLVGASTMREEADAQITHLLMRGRRQGIPIARLAEAAGLKTRKSVYDRTAHLGPWK